jgi:hypothetical protein
MSDKTRNLRYAGIVLLTTIILSEGALLTTSMSRQSITVGDPVRLTYSLIVKKGIKVVPPEGGDNFNPVTVREWNMQTSEREKTDSISCEYILTTYIPESCTIPSLPFLIISNDTIDTLFSPPLPLNVESVITSDSVTLKDLKPQHTAGKIPRWWMVPLIIAVLGLVISKGIGHYLRKKAGKIAVPPPRPPYEEAIDALAALELKKYIDHGMIREYVFELSEIFKRYIERRFTVNAAEFTTEEIVAWLGAAGLDSKVRTGAEWFFRETDPVKFARWIPERTVLEKFMKEVRTFLESTRPVISDKPVPASSVQALPGANDSRAFVHTADTQSGERGENAV